MRHLCICAIFLAACATEPLSGGDDAGAGTDGAAAQDFATPRSCADVSAAMSAVLASDVSCSSDGDCVLAHGPCGSPIVCGAAVNAAGAAALASLSDDWGALHCMGDCPPCPVPPPIACVGGRCQFTEPRGWGEPCTDDRQCVSGFCLTEARSPTFKNGYCSAPCNNNTGASCPQGMRCTTDGAGGQYCLVPCTSPSQCRQSDDYACCSGPGPSDGSGWCAPTRSFLCMAL